MSLAVVDQPGLKIVIFGLIASLFFGLSVRSQIRSVKVKHKFEVALQRLEKDLKIDFDTAEVQLSDWGWPRPYVVIREIRIRPLNESCQDTQLYVENISFPLDWDLIFNSKKIIASLNVSQAELRLGDLSQCAPFRTAQQIWPLPLNPNSKETSAAFAVNTPQNNLAGAAGSVNRKPSSLFSANTSAELKQVRIDRLKIVSKENYEKPIELRALMLNFTYNNYDERSYLQKIDLQTQAYAFRDQRKEIYLVKSDLKVEIFSGDKPGDINVQGNLIGKLIDRSFTVDFKYDPKTQEINFLHDVKALSLKAVVNLFEESAIDSDLQSSLVGFVVSFYGGGRYNIKTKLFSEYILKKINIQSDNASIEVHEIDVESLKPLQFKPFEAFVSRFDLSRFAQQKALKDISKSIDRFGEFSGSIKVKSKDDFAVHGFVQNLVVIFANQGLRALQHIDSFNLHLAANSKGLEFKLSDFVKNKLKINGILAAIQKIDEAGQSHVHAEVDLSGALLEPQVIKIFFDTEFEPDVSIRLKYQSQETLQAEIGFDKLFLKDVEIVNPLIKYSKNLSAATEKYNVRATNIIFSEQFLKKQERLQSIFAKYDPEFKGFSFLQPTLTLDLNRNRMGSFHLRTDLLSVERTNRQHVNIEGSLTERQNLMAQLSLRKSGKAPEKFSIIGNLEKLDMTVDSIK